MITENNAEAKRISDECKKKNQEKIVIQRQID